MTEKLELKLLHERYNALAAKLPCALAVPVGCDDEDAAAGLVASLEAVGFSPDEFFRITDEMSALYKKMLALA